MWRIHAEMVLSRLSLRICSAVNSPPQTLQRQYVDGLDNISGPAWASGRRVSTNSLPHSGHCLCAMADFRLPGVGMHKSTLTGTKWFRSALKSSCAGSPDLVLVFVGFGHVCLLACLGNCFHKLFPTFRG
jgi:hypothetical protein